MPLYNPITAASITDATAAARGLLTTLPTAVVDPAVVLISAANVATVIQGLTSLGVVSPVSNAQSVSGVVTTLT